MKRGTFRIWHKITYLKKTENILWFIIYLERWTGVWYISFRWFMHANVQKVRVRSTHAMRAQPRNPACVCGAAVRAAPVAVGSRTTRAVATNSLPARAKNFHFSLAVATVFGRPHPVGSSKSKRRSTDDRAAEAGDGTRACLVASGGAPCSVDRPAWRGTVAGVPRRWLLACWSVAIDRRRRRRRTDGWSRCHAWSSLSASAGQWPRPAYACLPAAAVRCAVDSLAGGPGGPTVGHVSTAAWYNKCRRAAQAQSLTRALHVVPCLHGGTARLGSGATGSGPSDWVEWNAREMSGYEYLLPTS